MESVVLEKERKRGVCVLPVFHFHGTKQAGERLSHNLLQTVQTLQKILLFSEGASGFTARQQLQITDSALWQ